jgi:hypothetical protein
MTMMMTTRGTAWRSKRRKAIRARLRERSACENGIYAFVGERPANPFSLCVCLLLRLVCIVLTTAYCDDEDMKDYK